jgi:hypothetical protein
MKINQHTIVEIFKEYKYPRIHRANAILINARNAKT